MFLKSDPERPEVDFDWFWDHFLSHFGDKLKTKSGKNDVGNLAEKQR